MAISLNAAQKEAVEYLGGPLLVLAGPGTGKTQLLSKKVEFILKNTDTNADNILCLTFTDSGAENMRERLKSVIGIDALKVKIGTYHSFGRDILAMYKNYNEDYDRRLDSAVDEVTQYKIVKEIQESLPPMDILRGDQISDMIDIISAAKSAQLTPEDLKNIALTNIADSEVISDAMQASFEKLVPYKFQASFDNCYREIHEILKDHTADKPLMPRVERIISVLAHDFEIAYKEAEESGRLKPLSDWRDRYFEKDDAGLYRLKDRVANKKLASMANVMASYESYLKENGLFDFDDMIQEAVKAISSDDGFRYTLQEKFQFIMLDEFQDTNPSQFTIVKLLTDYEKPLIMAVGDDDQAIYEFQGALSTNLTDFKKHYDAKVVKLTENYRSTQEILDFSHQVILQAPDRFDDKNLHANRPNPKESEIKRLEFLSSDAEYSYVAKKVAELVESGIEQKEIAIISEKRKYFEPLLPYLKAYPELKIAYEKRDDLFNDNKMHAIFTIARYIYEIANEKKPTVQVMEVLGYPFFHLPKLEILKLTAVAKHEHRPAFEVIAESENPEIKKTAEYFADLAFKSLTMPLISFIMEIVKEMEPEELSEYERFIFYENLAALKGAVIKHCGKETGLRLTDLIQMLDDYEDAKKPLIVKSPYRDADQAIQVMSAHKSKGLEFEYVFLISMDHSAWGKGKGNNNMLSLPKNLTFIRHTGTTDSEKIRVLYVALTRAKKGLFITNAVSDFNGKAPERVEYLQEFVDDDKKVVSPFLPDKFVTLEYDFGVLKSRESGIKNWLADYIVNSPDMMSIYKTRLSGLRMSASRLTGFVDVAFGGPMKFFEQQVLNAPDEADSYVQIFGTLLHQTFEKVTKTGISDEEALNYYLAEVDKVDLEEKDKDMLRVVGSSSLTKSLEKFRDIIRSGKAEVNFGAEKLSFEDVPLSGKIDHLEIDEKNKTIEIYDYKTSKYREGDFKSHAGLYEKMLQLEFYKLLVNLSQEYRNYKVTKGHILFVTEDKEDGEVHDKEYIYNEKDELEFKELLRSVYHHMISLDFLDDPKMNWQPNPEAKIKEMKDFIKLMLAKSVEK